MNRKTIDLAALIAGLSIMLLGLYLLYFGSEAGTAAASETGANDTFKYIVMAIGFVSVLPWVASRLEDHEKKRLQSGVKSNPKPLVTEDNPTSLAMPLLMLAAGIVTVSIPYLVLLFWENNANAKHDDPGGLGVFLLWLVFVPAGFVVGLSGLLITIKRIIQRNVKK